MPESFDSKSKSIKVDIMGISTKMLSNVLEYMFSCIGPILRATDAVLQMWLYVQHTLYVTYRGPECTLISKHETGSCIFLNACYRNPSELYTTCFFSTEPLNFL